MMDFIKYPILTEKSNAGIEKGIYTFVVDKKANKIQIKQDVEKTFGVNVEEVRTMICRGKRKVRYTRKGVQAGRKNSYKKAIVTLAPGEIIDIYQNSPVPATETAAAE
jgi:large subunit ribosomal protein L23